MIAGVPVAERYVDEIGAYGCLDDNLDVVKELPEPLQREAGLGIIEATIKCGKYLLSI